MAECDMGLLTTRFVNRMERDVVGGGAIFQEVDLVSKLRPEHAVMCRQGSC